MLVSTSSKLIVPSSHIVILKTTPSKVPDNFSPLTKAISLIKRILAPFTADTKFKNLRLGLNSPIIGSFTSSALVSCLVILFYLNYKYTKIILNNNY